MHSDVHVQIIICPVDLTIEKKKDCLSPLYLTARLDIFSVLERGRGEQGEEPTQFTGAKGMHVRTYKSTVEDGSSRNKRTK
jgi:hypothetical protein